MTRYASLDKGRISPNHSTSASDGLDRGDPTIEFFLVVWRVEGVLVCPGTDGARGWSAPTLEEEASNRSVLGSLIQEEGLVNNELDLYAGAEAGLIQRRLDPKPREFNH